MNIGKMVVYWLQHTSQYHYHIMYRAIWITIRMQIMYRKIWITMQYNYHIMYRAIWITMIFYFSMKSFAFHKWRLTYFLFGVRVCVVEWQMQQVLMKASWKRYLSLLSIISIPQGMVITSSRRNFHTSRYGNYELAA